MKHGLFYLFWLRIVSKVQVLRDVHNEAESVQALDVEQIIFTQTSWRRIFKIKIKSENDT